jgi:serine protease Do
MKKNKWNILAFAGIGLLTSVAPVVAEENKDKPRESAEAFNAKITRDSAEVRNAGQIVMSYADVVQKILPSVVSISTYSKKPMAGHGNPFGGGGGMNEDDLDALPPMFRQFFEDYLKRGGQMPKNKRQQQPQRPSKPQQTGLGSGVLLTADGYILTNNHVVEGADELRVMIGGKTKEYMAKVIGTDPSTDVALIKIEGTNLPHATIGDSSKLRVGDVVLAVGSPMGLDQSVTQGIVSAMGRSQMGIIGNDKLAGYENFIQTDAAINPGNSGGPLVDASGRVIGVNTAIETKSGMFSGIGLAIPINMAVSVVTDLLEGGKVQRGFLGVHMAPVDQSVAEFLGLTDGGVTVDQVVESSPAAKAGFQEGDVIVAAAGEKASDPAGLRLLISSKHPGTDIKFSVVRFSEKSKKSEKLELTAKLEALPENMSAMFEKGGKGGNGPNAGNSGTFLKGVKVKNITDEDRQGYNIGEEVKGILVTAVEDSSAAAKVGLQEGDVIVSVNRQAVSSVAEALSIKGESTDTMLIKISRNGQTKTIAVKG